MAPVARLISSEGTVRKLGRDELVWDKVWIDSAFNVGDTISTSENANAKLVFEDGGDLWLGPGSMVVLSGNTTEVKLKFISGASRVRLAKVDSPRLTVTPDRDSESKPGAAVVQKPRVTIEYEGGSAPVAVLSQVKTRPYSKPKRPVSQFGGNGEVVSALSLPPIPTLQAPENEKTIDAGIDSALTLSWSLPGSKTSTTPKELSYEITLRSVIAGGTSKILSTREPSLSLQDLPMGRFAWFVRAIDQNGNRGPASSQRYIEIRKVAKISRPKIMPAQQYPIGAPRALSVEPAKRPTLAKPKTFSVGDQ